MRIEAATEGLVVIPFNEWKKMLADIIGNFCPSFYEFVFYIDYRLGIELSRTKSPAYRQSNLSQSVLRVRQPRMARRRGGP